MDRVVITVSEFREGFPEFSNATKYKDAYITRQINTAEIFISDKNYLIRPEVRKLAIEYMTAHLIYLENLDANGNFVGWDDSATSGAVTSSHIGDVSVSLQPPIATEEWELWLEATPYGKMLLALLELQVPKALYYPGRPNPWGIK